MTWFWRYLLGYVTVRISGLSLEKMLNLMGVEGIRIWGVKRPSHTVMTAKVGKGRLEALLDAASRSRCKVEILGRRGLPYLWQNLLKRKVLVFGVALFVAALIFLSSFIWDVEVVGTEKLDPAGIMDYLNSQNVKPGIRQSEVDFHVLADDILGAFPELSWVGISMKGMRLHVEVVEGEPKPEMIDESVPADIVAGRDAVVYEITALAGKAKVKAGDTVRKGDVLIEGALGPEERQIRVRAKGTVLGRVYYEGTVVRNMNEDVAAETGRTAVRRYIDMGTWTVPVEGEKPDYDDYELSQRRTPLLGKLYFPVYLVEEEYREVIRGVAEKDADSVAKAALEEAYQQALAQVPDPENVLLRKDKVTVEGGELRATVYLEVSESIGVVQP